MPYPTVRTGKIVFERHKGGVNKESATIKFDNKIISAATFIQGVDVKFVEEDGRKKERPFHRLHYKIAKTEISSSEGGGGWVPDKLSREVTVTAELGLRDASLDWDDYYEGTIYVAVLALEHPTRDGYE
ncbi:hypothetical protein FHR84_003349 [Actinopolyspora biskrensis]|uniref:Uncharacterized protein n=1 Tax=Actinopolyspora biskrensis TaxID=1470178 RepID=A0A852Z1E0_9ACTN|nr:hypothetical protein [Actinopolyspora biskrensis]NYH80000.1 hypothetical protein [Actinopolyspora biskrensis]